MTTTMTTRAVGTLILLTGIAWPATAQQPPAITSTPSTTVASSSVAADFCGSTILCSALDGLLFFGTPSAAAPNTPSSSWLAAYGWGVGNGRAPQTALLIDGQFVVTPKPMIRPDVCQILRAQWQWKCNDESKPIACGYFLEGPRTDCVGLWGLVDISWLPSGTHTAQWFLWTELASAGGLPFTVTQYSNSRKFVVPEGQ